RATGTRTARDHRRHPRLYGARTNWTDESLDRLPERSLLTWGHALSNADGQSSVHGFRSNGVGPLPYRADAAPTKRTVECPGPHLCHHHEVARQDPGGALSDRIRP